MKRRFFFIVLFLALLILCSQAYADTNYKSRNGIDSIKITKITPRSLSHLLKPVNMPVHLELDYKLKTAKKGKVVVYFYKIYKKGITKKMEFKEITHLRKVYSVKKGRKIFLHVSDPVVIKANERVIQLYTAASLVNDKGKELAFSTSKNFISGTYKIFPDKKASSRDYLIRLGVKPETGSILKTEKTVKFEISLKYSLATRQIAYIDILFADVSELGTGRCWVSATVAVPKGSGKILLRPEVFFGKNFKGNNMGIGISYWLRPLKESMAYLKIIDYFLR